MGHADVNRTFATYGGWVREMGADAAALRERWADGANTAPNRPGTSTKANIEYPQRDSNPCYRLERAGA
jgi:hypothetical protein